MAPTIENGEDDHPRYTPPKTMEQCVQPAFGTSHNKAALKTHAAAVLFLVVLLVAVEVLPPAAATPLDQKQLVVT